MTILSFAVFLLLFYLVLFLFNYLLRSLAYFQGSRFLNIRPVVSVLIAVLTLTNGSVLSGLLRIVDAVINSAVLKPFFDSVLPRRAYELLYMLLCVLGTNLFIVVSACIIVGLIRLFFPDKRGYINTEDMSLGEKFIHLPWLLVNRYYDDKGREQELNPKGYNIYFWTCGFRNAFAVTFLMETLIIAISVLWGQETWNQRLLSASEAWYLLPFAMFILFQEWELTLTPEKDGEAGSYFYGEVKEELVGDVNKLVGQYEQQFGKTGALLHSEEENPEMFIHEGLPNNDLSNQQIEGCRSPEVLQFMVEQLKEEGLELSDPYINVLQQLLNDESVFVRDINDGEIAPYLTVYLNYHLSQGKTALVLCADEKHEELLKNALKNNMRQLNALSSVWEIESGSTVNNNQTVHVLVCSWDSPEIKNLYSINKEFTEELFCTVILDAPKIFSQDGIHLGRMVEELHRLKRDMQYILVSDENNANLATAIQETLHVDLTHFSNDIRLPHTRLMVWKEESSYRLQNSLHIGEKSPYMGTALPLVLVAVKSDLPEVNIVSDATRGDITYSIVLSQDRQDVNRYLDDSNIDLNGIIRTDPAEIIKSNGIRVAVIYDTAFNMFSAAWKWMKYGGKNGTVLHIVSPPYMLRGYFAANFKRLIMNDNQYESLVPHTVGLDVNQAAEILMSLSGVGLSDSELMEKNRSLGWHCDTVEEFLERCLRLVLPDQQISSVIYEYFRFEQTNKPEAEDIWGTGAFRVWLTNDSVAKRINDNASFAEVSINGRDRVRLNVLKRNISNYYLRDQLAVFDSKICRIARISDGIVEAEQVTPNAFPQYYAVSSFNLQDIEKIDDLVDTDFMDINLYRSNIERHIRGYWESDQGNNLSSSKGVMFHSLINNEGTGLVSRVDNAVILEIAIRKSGFKEKETEAANLLCFMISELSKTLFPSIWQNIFVMTDGCNDVDLIDRVLTKGNNTSLEDKIQSIIPWADIKEGKGYIKNEEYVRVYIAEFTPVEYGAVQLLRNRLDQLFGLLGDYLSWYMKQNKAEMTGKGEKAEKEETAFEKYLHFGAKEIPGLFAPEELQKFLSRFITSGPSASGSVKKPERTGMVCSYCFKPIVFGTEMENGKRHMCRECRNSTIKEEKIIELYHRTVEFIEKDYGFKFKRNVKVRFLSAEDIEKRIGKGAGERTLGYYDNETRELVLESPGPRTAMLDTLTHELTHRWQYDTLNIRKLERKLHNEDLFLEVLEGHATYVEIDCMRRLNEAGFADRLVAEMEHRNDEYGRGYRRVREYIRDKEADGSHINALTAMQSYVEAIIKGEIKLK